ncbi:hypothetical protein HDF14_003402 [Edaphobacter lichenicola]|uniref:Uncharacterized protein n=1 Tax=Tunturiibacter gelidiferens TaxID=3069689 RepID=A0A9X0QG73_9BACT|nr:hypothetical protein [Edaphobacter lichenicola]
MQGKLNEAQSIAFCRIVNGMQRET